MTGCTKCTKNAVSCLKCVRLHAFFPLQSVSLEAGQSAQILGIGKRNEVDSYLSQLVCRTQK